MGGDSERTSRENRTRGAAGEDSPRRAIRVSLTGSVQGAGLRAATIREAARLGVMGWVRNEEDGSVAAHAEGPPAAVDEWLRFMRAGPAASAIEQLAASEVKVEGHEQFALRGVSAGIFVVQEHAASTHHFDLRLEVDGAMRSWAVPRGPSMDPAVKRLAIGVEDHELPRDSFEGPSSAGAVAIWDRGTYEQGGRVPWPEALDRGHAVFVLHGHKLRGGFALQRTRPGARAQWLLIKRRDQQALPGSDVVEEQPASVLSGLTLREIVARAG